MDCFARHGFWPIMHIVALSDAAVAANPSLPMQLLAAFRSAAEVASAYLADPNWSQLVWGKYSVDEERAAFGQPLWTTGVAANHANVERFLGYSYDQGLTGRRLAVEELFHRTVIET